MAAAAILDFVLMQISHAWNITCTNMSSFFSITVKRVKELPLFSQIQDGECRHLEFVR